MVNTYICHHGIKGMHWGIRRFQPYADGAKRKGKEIGQAAKKKAKATSDKYPGAFKPGKDGKPSPSEKVTRATGDVIGSTKNIIRSTQPKKHHDTSHMSDNELRQRINRLEMEKRYDNLMNSDLSSGRQKAMEILDVVGNIVAIGASTAAIGTAIYGAKKK